MTCRIRDSHSDAAPTLFRRIFGSPKHAPNNVAFVVLMLTFGIGLIGILVYPNDGVDLWACWTPIITLVFGYLMGKNARR